MDLRGWKEKEAASPKAPAHLAIVFPRLHSNPQSLTNFRVLQIKRHGHSASDAAVAFVRQVKRMRSEGIDIRTANEYG